MRAASFYARPSASQPGERERERERGGGEAGRGDGSLFFSACLCPPSSSPPPSPTRPSLPRRRFPYLCAMLDAIDGSLIFARGRRAFAVSARSISSRGEPEGRKGGSVAASQGPRKSGGLMSLAARRALANITAGNDPPVNTEYRRASPDELPR